MKLDPCPAGSFRQRFHADDLGEDINEVVLGDSDAQDQSIPFPQVSRGKAYDAGFG
jgi:hypothetical protein